jgi:hypothetical protein
MGVKLLLFPENGALYAMRRVTSSDATVADKFLLSGAAAVFQNSGNFLGGEQRAQRPAGNQNCQRSQAKNTLPLL